MEGVIVAQDLATGLCGLLNTGYFVSYWWRRDDRRSRRIGAAALAMVSAAVVVEAIFSQGLFWIRQEAFPLGELSLSMWALARLPLLVATLFLSLLVLRRLSSSS